MPTAISLLGGAILAGGLSTRMGRDKALIEHEGLPLWRRQYNFLAKTGVSERIVSVRPDQTWLPLDVTRVNDAAPDLGPLSGITAALGKTRHDHLFVLAVDMPRVPVAWVSRLREACADRIGAVGRNPQGYFEPLAAIYPQAMLARLRSALTERELSLQKLITAAVDEGLLRVRDIAADEQAWFENWNDPSAISG